MILMQVQQILSHGKGMTIKEIVERIPELYGREQGDEILRLLLRLDRRFEKNGDLWFCRVTTSDLTARIVSATKEYFKNHPRGELLGHLVSEVSKTISEDSQIVKEVILNTFQSLQSGKMILNQLKEKRHD